MKMFLIFLLLLPGLVLGQASTPNDTFKVGQGSSSSDKGIIFDTNDGVSNKSLKVEKVSKNLKFDGNTFQLGDGSSSSDKTILINGASKSLKYNGTAGQFEFDQMLQITGGLKTNTISPRTGTENTFSNDVRATGKVFVGAGNNQLRVSGGNLEFSNDGSLFKKVGSGSGQGDSGVNLLENASFEDGLTPGWTNVGGTFTQQTYTNSTEGDTKYARFVASGSGQYFESTAKVLTDNLTGGCLAYAKYKTTDNNAFKISFFSAGSEISFANLISTSGAWSTTPYVPVLCPASGTLLKVRFESLASGTLEVDKVYQGSENRTIQISAARLVAKVVYPVTASCTQSRSTAGFGSLGTVAACGAPTVSYYNQGGVVISTADQDAASKFTITTLPKGILEVRMKGAMDQGGTTSFHQFRLTDGTTFGEQSFVFASSGGLSGIPIVTYKAAYSSGASNLTIELQTQFNSPATSTILQNSTQIVEYEVYLWPLDTDTALTSDQSAWQIDANIGGANPSLGATSITSYTGIENASLDMVLRPGSSSAQIACSSTNAPTGLTCSSGNESVSVAWTPPYTGWFDVCFDFSHNFDLASTAVADAVFQVVETGINNQTILAEGGSKVESRGNITAANNLTFPHRVCGSFLVSSVSQKVHRLMYELSASGTVNTNVLNADRNASLGQRDIRVTVRPSTMNLARPVLIGDMIKRAVITGDGTNALTASTYTTRDLSVEQSDEYNIVSLSSDQFTLGAGTYHLSIDYSVHRVDTYNSVITNITDASNACTGIQGYASNASATGAQASYSCIITISAPKTFALQFNPSSTASANYYGSQITIDKIK